MGVGSQRIALLSAGSSGLTDHLRGWARIFRYTPIWARRSYAMIFLWRKFSGRSI